MKKKFISIGLILLGLIFVVAAIRIFSGEDDWLCQNGEWVRHGNPSAPMPTEKCE